MADINYTASTPKKSYTRRIGDNGFLGADFSTAPIFASDRRFRDLKNVWKDYKSGSGVAIETIPGVRKVPNPSINKGYPMVDPNPTVINGFYLFAVIASTGDYLSSEVADGTWLGVHIGNELHFVRPDNESTWSTSGVAYNYSDPFANYVTAVLPNEPSVALQAGNKLLILCGGKVYSVRLATTNDRSGFVNDEPYGFFVEVEWGTEATSRFEAPTTYVPTTFIDGEPYEQKNMISLRSKEIYHKTIAELTSGTYGVEIVLHEKVKKGDLPYKSNIVSLTVDGTSKLADATATVSGDYVSSLSITGYLSGDVGTHVTVEIEYVADPAKFTSYRGFEEYKDRTTFNEGNPGYTGTAYDAIAGCTICASFDERIFLAGNPKLPNTIFYSQRDLTGYNNATYFGVLNYNNLGTSNAPIKAMIPSASTLCVLKDDSATDPTLYFLTGLSTEQDLVPRIYTVESGLPGIGCKGAACNFLDDIVFMSRNGVIGIDKQAVNLERTLGDRSALINGKLLQEDVTQAVFAEAEGYLWCLFKYNGHVYLADSRAYTQGAGYEWYFIDSVGSWENDADAYFFSDNYVFANGTLVDGKQVAEVEDKTYASGIAQTEDGDLTYYYEGTVYKVVARGTADEQASTVGKITVYLDYTRSSEYNENHEWYNVSWTPDTSGAYIELLPTGETVGGVPTYYQIIPTGEKVGGTFHPATYMVTSNDRVFFGTEDGVLLTFNNDKRGERAASEDETEPNRYPFLLRPEWYTFCGHRIESFVETSDDDGGIGNLTKDTVRRSAVVDMKAMLGSKYRITTYTDRDGWKNDNAATGSMNDASQTMLDAVNFSGDEHINVQIRERSRKWVHKRYRIESDGFRSPFGLYRITYNFEINGRIK